MTGSPNSSERTQVNEYNERSFWLRVRAMLSISDPRWGRSDGNGNRQRPNDPKRGQGDAEGPPDLDELWRDFNRRLARLFGGKGEGGGSPGDRRPDNGRAARIGVGIVIGVLIAIYFGSGVFVVQEGQAGVVLQFGQYRSTVSTGVHWRLPYPFQTHELVNVAQTRAVEIGRGNAVSDAGVKDASMLTRDGDIVDVRLVVQYQVKSPTDFLFQAADPDRSVAQAAQAAVRAFVGTQSTQAVLNANRDALGVQLADAIKRALERDRTGLAVTGVAVQRIDPPQQVQAAFEDVARARADRDRAKREAQAYANDIVPRAKTDGQRAIEDAKTYAARVVADARSDAERFKAAYAQYAKAPAVVRERMYRDTMRDIYSNSRKVFVSGKGGATVNVTLENAASAAQAAAASAPASAAPASASASAAPAAAASAAPTPASQAAAASDAMRSRDTLRSRAREDDLQQ